MAEKEHNTEGGTTTERHPDVEEEKKAAKARGNPSKGGQGQITTLRQIQVISIARVSHSHSYSLRSIARQEASRRSVLSLN